MELGQSALQQLPVERTNLHSPILVEVSVVLVVSLVMVVVVVLVVVLLHQVLAVVDLMGKRRPSAPDTVVRTIRRNLSLCSCYHPVRSVTEVAARAL